MKRSLRNQQVLDSVFITSQGLLAEGLCRAAAATTNRTAFQHERASQL